MSLSTTFLFVAFAFIQVQMVYAQDKTTWWEVQSVDTMKYSRDLSRQKLKSSSFDAVIDKQISDIAALGSTHVAIATPYDEEFYPMLVRWVTAARKNGLKVWFRGNFSGWEKWFDYPRMTRADHLKLTTTFIKAHGNLFEDGDIFTPCPECENGGPGDPRQTGDIQGHRNFLIDSYNTATSAFREIGAGVKVGYFSMNYDVAKAIMDKKTTEALGGIVVIDHYIPSAVKLAIDAKNIAEASGGKVFFGEFGAPIPDLHGNMNEESQAKWVSQALDALAREPSVIGVNYWVNVGGSTQMWSESGTPRKVTEAMTSYYTPKRVSGRVLSQFNKPIADVDVSTIYKSVMTDKNGYFFIPVLPSDIKLTAKYQDTTIADVDVPTLSGDIQIIIPITQTPWWQRIFDIFVGLFK